MSQSLRYEELTSALARLGYGEDAAGFHGMLCGALCVKPAQQIDLLALLKEGEGGSFEDLGDDDSLPKLCGQTAAALASSEMTFAPLLPNDDLPLGTRAQSLGAWCEGFLFGLALGPQLDLKQCSAEMKEILHDFTQFTQAVLGENDDAEIEETAYAELVEYLRVGVQLIFMELRGRARHETEPKETTLH